MKKLILAAGVLALSSLSLITYAEPTMKASSAGKSYVSCETGKTAKEAADQLNRFSTGKWSSPSVAVTNTGEVIVCAIMIFD